MDAPSPSTHSSKESHNICLCKVTGHTCQTAIKLSEPELVVEFSRLRKGCVALKELFLPDEIWPGYEAQLNNPDRIAHHRPTFFGLFMMGVLAKITDVAHRHFFDGNKLKAQVTRQYRADLKDNWIIRKHSPIDRHKEGRRFHGKLAELNLVRWLECHGWRMLDLAALGGVSDLVVTKRLRMVRCAIEVKLLGVEDAVFNSIVHSLQKRPSGYWSSPADGVNFVLFKIYEAAQQLLAIKGLSHRIAALIIEPLTWVPLGKDLKNGWIDWLNPQFLPHTSQSWDAFFFKQKQREPGIEGNVCKSIRQLDEIWIFRQKEDFDLEREIRIKI